MPRPLLSSALKQATGARQNVEISEEIRKLLFGLTMEEVKVDKVVLVALLGHEEQGPLMQELSRHRGTAAGCGVNGLGREIW